ncbi:MAG: ABC transporter ATP-binding protein [Polaromonas sp.]|nr:ABC transporter ATP-binding protein [Polaromonas sp.]
MWQTQYASLLTHLHTGSNQFFIGSYKSGINTASGFHTLVGIKIKSTWLAEWGTHHLLLLLCVFYVLALAFRIFANERIAHINMTEGYALSAEIFKKSLDQPYSWNFSNHSADTRASILHDTQDLISFITIPLGRLISQISLLLAIVIVLLWIQPVLTLFLGFIFSAIYFLIYIFMKVGLQKMSYSVGCTHQRHRLSTDAYIAIRN